MKNCENCQTPEECLEWGECEIKALEMLDDCMQNNEFGEFASLNVIN